MLNSPWSRTIKAKISTFPCQGMYKKHSYISISNNQVNLNINHTPMFLQTMERKFNMPLQKTQLILHLSNGQHKAYHPQHPSNRAGNNATAGKTISWLHHIKQWCSTHIPCQQYVLAVHSKASYFGEPKVQSRVGGTSSYQPIPHFPQTNVWYITQCKS